MHPAIRTQASAGAGNDSFSLDAGTDTSDLPDLARQEFKDEADVNWILARFGVHGPSRQVVYGEVDYTIDLQQAYALVDDVEHALRRMPQHLRTQFRTAAEFLEALDAGLIKPDDLKDPNQEAPPPEPTIVPPAD